MTPLTPSTAIPLAVEGLTSGITTGQAVAELVGEASKATAAPPALIPLRNQLGETIAYALVDAGDADMVNQWRWSLDYRGYAIRASKRDGKQYTVRLHNQVFGPIAEGLEVDHINRNKLDNRRVNLRAGTHAENMRNRGPRENSRRSGVTGVIWDRLQERWIICCYVDGKKVRYGSYPTVEEAVAVIEVEGLRVSRRPTKKSRRAA
jgi:hypothetical protein